MTTLLSDSLYNPPTAPFSGAGSAPTANTAAVETLTPSSAKVAIAVGGVAWSYSNTPTGGNLTIKDGSNVVFNLDITAGGPGSILFRVPLRATPGNTLTITLAAGGASVSGKVVDLGAWEI